MQTSLVRYLRERIHAFSARRAVLLAVLIGVPIILNIGILVLLDGVKIERAIWLWFGGIVLVGGILALVVFLVLFEDKLEKQRGLTIGKIIGSSGFALIRSESQETPKTSWLYNYGSLYLTNEISVMKIDAAARRHRGARFKAAIRSSGFSVVRENLQDKDSHSVD